MEYPPLVPGILLQRYKRFLADVELDDGRVVVAHCPNTGSMRAVNVPGSRVWLSPSDNPKRKLAWTWELIELPQTDGSLAIASVQTGRANAIVEEALCEGVIAPLAGFETLKREASVTDARLDFRLTAADGAATYVEVKQVTLKETDGHGYFPDAVSARGRKHLEALARLAAEGQRAVLLFCVAHEGIDSVAPATHLDPAYAATLREVAACGVEVLAYRCALERKAGVPRAIRLAQRLPVTLTRTLETAGG
ncbi:sugar fermentation stimulation protein A [Franzmannia pantelleriensis]|uniref:Sugar fermentation stimulation protein homolog n=1 Tax=Franzmannia pantelleriensis TaxID=48727 RepID=A0A1G9TIV9_9GAMM|nr:DNA/RNA nuclease SfsA [Halomonas pantelleriensis]SDM47562.1 sugar fermentation stimulation protein A [Halomonas pantelleriensis]